MTEEWRAPAAERVDPDYVADERSSLEHWLDYHRATLLQKCAGLTAEELKRRSVPPSSMSLLGLVRHMTDVEAGWFRGHAAGETVTFRYAWAGNDDGEFDDVDEADAPVASAAFLQECAASRAAVAGRDLDDVLPSPRGRPDRDIRWIFVHMIEEYARHNGHADLMRECIDGVVGD